MSFKDFFSIFSSGSHFVLGSGNRLGNLGMGPYKEHFGVIILNLVQQFRKRCY